jgi:transcriptional regulator
MYQPGHGKFRVDDPLALLTEIAPHRAATLVSLGDDGFWTTLLPLIVGDGVLRGHVARANRHWRALERDSGAVAIFYGPDAYISPAWYEEKRLTGKVVPTWNYSMVAVHGTITVHHEPDWLLENVRALVLRHETARLAPWFIEDAPEGYVETQARAIVGLELAIERVEAKEKLTQNRSLEDFEGVFAALSKGPPRERAVARDMATATKRPRRATRS